MSDNFDPNEWPRRSGNSANRNHFDDDDDFDAYDDYGGGYNPPAAPQGGSGPGPGPGQPPARPQPPQQPYDSQPYGATNDPYGPPPSGPYGGAPRPASPPQGPPPSDDLWPQASNPAPGTSGGPSRDDPFDDYDIPASPGAAAYEPSSSSGPYNDPYGDPYGVPSGAGGGGRPSEYGADSGGRYDDYADPGMREPYGGYPPASPHNGDYYDSASPGPGPGPGPGSGGYGGEEWNDYNDYDSPASRGRDARGPSRDHDYDDYSSYDSPGDRSGRGGGRGDDSYGSYDDDDYDHFDDDYDRFAEDDDGGSGSKRLILIGAGALVLLLVLSFGAYSFLGNKGSDQASNKPPATTPQTPASDNTQPSENTTPSAHSDANTPPDDVQGALSNALDAWGKFAANGDLAVVKPFFVEEGKSYQRLVADAPAIRERKPEEAPRLTIKVNNPKWTKKNDNSWLVRGTVVFAADTFLPEENPAEIEIVRNNASEPWKILSMNPTGSSKG